MRSRFAVAIASLLAAVPAGAVAQGVGPLRPAIDDTAPANPNAPRGTIVPEDDPYAALGIRAGGFVLFPSLTTTLGSTTNAAGEAGSGGSAYGILAPELRIESDWGEHAAGLTLRGAYQSYFDGVSDAKPTGAVDATGRIDLRDGWQADFAAGYSYEQQSRTNPDFPTPADAPPGVHDLKGSAAISGGAGRAKFTAEGRVERSGYEDAVLSGVPFDQSDRDNTLVAARLRAGYEATPTLTPFVEGEVSRRLYDQTVDNDGLRRSSTGYALRAGVAFDRDPILTGEIAAGVIQEDFDDPALATLNALSVDGSLAWMPTALTTVNLDASTAFNAATDPASSGSVEYDAKVELAYAWRRNVTLSARAGYMAETFQGTGGTETTVSAGLGATWKVNRTLHITAGYLHEWFTGTTPADDYQSDAVQVELRFQR